MTDWNTPDPQQKPDPQAECADCGHWDYHHRPECGYKFTKVVECSCPRFRKGTL